MSAQIFIVVETCVKDTNNKARKVMKNQDTYRGRWKCEKGKRRTENVTSDGMVRKCGSDKICKV